MKGQVTLVLSVEQAEPILRKAAEEAARYSSYVDYIRNKQRTARAPNGTPERWQEHFIRAKKLVEAFGVDYEQVSEGETLTVYVPYRTLKSHLVNIGGVTFRHIDKSIPEPNRKKWMPELRGEHEEACRQAADRTVRKWKLSLETQQINDDTDHYALSNGLPYVMPDGTKVNW